jgi:hypothetical protein
VTVNLQTGIATGEGTDTILNVDSVVGSAFADTLLGNAGANWLYGRDGDDVLLGLDGNDTLSGDGGRDLLFGGAGDDVINGGTVDDQVWFYNSAAGVTVNLELGTATGEGNDTITNVESVIGSQFNDNITGNDANNVIAGLDGGDRLYGQGGDDRLEGGAGNDTLSGGSGSDVLLGGIGNDVFWYGNQDDTSDVQLGNDQLYGEDGDDTLNVRILTGGGRNLLLDGGAGNDHFVLSNSSFLPSSFQVVGGSGNVTIELYGGNPDASTWQIDAGDGNDVVRFFNAPLSTLTLGTGQDVVEIANILTFDRLVIMDFAAGASGDQMNLVPWFAANLEGWDGSANPFGVAGFARLLQSGADTLVQIDLNGGGNAWQTLATFQNVTATALTAAQLGGYPTDGLSGQADLFGDDPQPVSAIPVDDYLAFDHLQREDAFDFHLTNSLPSWEIGAL